MFLLQKKTNWPRSRCSDTHIISGCKSSAPLALTQMNKSKRAFFIQEFSGHASRALLRPSSQGCTQQPLNKHKPHEVFQAFSTNCLTQRLQDTRKDKYGDIQHFDTKRPNQPQLKGSEFRCNRKNFIVEVCTLQ